MSEEGSRAGRTCTGFPLTCEGRHRAALLTARALIALQRPCGTAPPFRRPPPPPGPACRRRRRLLRLRLLHMPLDMEFPGQDTMKLILLPPSTQLRPEDCRARRRTTRRGTGRPARRSKSRGEREKSSWWRQLRFLNPAHLPLPGPLTLSTRPLVLLPKEAEPCMGSFTGRVPNTYVFEIVFYLPTNRDTSCTRNSHGPPSRAVRPRHTTLLPPFINCLPPPPCCLHLNPLLELHTLRNPRTIPPRTTPTVSFNPTSSSFNHTSIPHVHRATGALSPPLTFPSSLLLSPTSPRLPPPPLVFIVLRSTISSGCAPHSLRPPPTRSSRLRFRLSLPIFLPPSKAELLHPTVLHREAWAGAGR